MDDSARPERETDKAKMSETELEQLRRFNNQKAEALERAHDKLEHQENRVSELSAETEHLEKKVKLLVEALERIVRLMVAMQSLGYFTNPEWTDRLAQAQQALAAVKGKQS